MSSRRTTTRPRTSWCVTRTHDVGGLPGNNTSRSYYGRRQELGYKNVNTWPHGHQQRAAQGPPGMHADRILLPGLQVRREMVDAVRRHPGSRGHRPARPARSPSLTRIEHDDKGKHPASSTSTRTARSNVRRRVSCVSPANSIETARLLLNSQSPQHPNGLANSSGQVGRNYQRHMTGSVYGIFEKRPAMRGRPGGHPRGLQSSEARAIAAALMDGRCPHRSCRAHVTALSKMP